MREAIRITAERTFEALSPEDQQAARQLFLRLVTPGEGQEDTRARAAMPLEPAQLKIVEQFAGPRTRLLVTGSDRARRPTVEVAHEALIRTWPRLRRWIDANREKLRARAAVLQAKADWEQNGRRDDMLLPAGLQLERARTLLADPGDITIDDIKEFISRSSAREEAALKQAATREARTRRLRWAVSSSVVGLLVFLGIASVAWQQRNLANRSRERSIEIVYGFVEATASMSDRVGVPVSTTLILLKQSEQTLMSLQPSVERVRTWSTEGLSHDSGGAHVRRNRGLGQASG